MEHYFAIETNDSHLEHHGRKGQKWYQHIFSKDRGSGATRKRAEGDSGATGKGAQRSNIVKAADGTYLVVTGDRALVIGASNPLEASVWESKRVGDVMKMGMSEEHYRRDHNDNLNHAPTPFNTREDRERHEVAREKRSKMGGKEAERDLDEIAKCLSDTKMSEKSDDEQMRELNTSREFRATVWAPQDRTGRNAKILNASNKYLDVADEPESVRKAPREELAKACLEEMGYQKSFAHDPRILEKYSKQLIEATPSEYYVKHSEPFNGVNFRIV